MCEEAFRKENRCPTIQAVFGLNLIYSKTCVNRPLSKRPKIGFQDQLSFNAGQKYCRMLQGEHSAKLLTFINLTFGLNNISFLHFKNLQNQ